MSAVDSLVLHHQLVCDGALVDGLLVDDLDASAEERFCEVYTRQ